MIVTLNHPTPAGSRRWTFTWSSTGAAHYYVYWRGDLVAVLDSATLTYTMTAPAGQYPANIEVTDDPTDVPQQIANPVRVHLQWDIDPETPGSGAPDRVVITRNGATVATIATIAAQTHYTWDSPVLSDDTTWSFAVVPYDALGNPGPSLAASSMTIARNPDLPSATATYNPATGRLTLS